jgi:hypothetical protein
MRGKGMGDAGGSVTSMRSSVSPVTPMTGEGSPRLNVTDGCGGGDAT